MDTTNQHTNPATRARAEGKKIVPFRSLAIFLTADEPEDRRVDAIEAVMNQLRQSEAWVGQGRVAVDKKTHAAYVRYNNQRKADNLAAFRAKYGVDVPTI